VRGAGLVSGVGGSGGVHDDLDVAVLEDELHHRVRPGQLQGVGLPVPHELPGALGHSSPRTPGLLHPEVPTPVVRAVHPQAPGQPAPGPLLLGMSGHRIRVHLRGSARQQLPQRPRRQLAPHLADPLHDLSRGLRAEELGLLRHHPGTLLIQLPTGHRVDHRRGADHLSDRIQDPVRSHMHRHTQPRRSKLRSIQTLVPQPVMHLRARAVLLHV
jgi:hypothetical protein